LNLVGYEDEVARAMEYVFGNTLICADAATAQRVTFDPAVRMMSVTIEGDVYDPSGTLSGGSAPTSSGVLITLGKLNEITRELAAETLSLHNLQAKMASERKRLDQAKQYKQALDLKNHEVKLTEDQINNNSSSNVRFSSKFIHRILLTNAQIIQALEEMKTTIQQLKSDIVEAKARQAQAIEDVKQTERDMNDFNNNKDSKLAELQVLMDFFQSRQQLLTLTRTLLKETRKLLFKNLKH